MKKIFIIALAAITIASFSSCDGTKTLKKQQTAYPVEILNVVVSSKPTKVASLSPMLTTIFSDLGYSEQLIALSSTCPNSKESPKPTIGSGVKPDFEKIGELAPEIVFTNTPIPSSQMQKLAEVKIKVVVVPVPKTIDELKLIYTNIISIMSGNIEATTTGKASIDEFTTQLNSIKKQLQEKPVSFLYVEKLDPIIATGDTFQSDVLSFFGTNLVADKKAFEVTADEVTALNPDVIFFSNDLSAEHIKTSDMFKKSSAVLNDKLIPVDTDVFYRPTRKLPQNLATIANLLYPNMTFPNLPKNESSTISDVSQTSSASEGQGE